MGKGICNQCGKGDELVIGKDVCNKCGRGGWIDAVMSYSSFYKRVNWLVFIFFLPADIGLLVLIIFYEKTIFYAQIGWKVQETEAH